MCAYIEKVLMNMKYFYLTSPRICLTFSQGEILDYTNTKKMIQAIFGLFEPFKLTLEYMYP